MNPLVWLNVAESISEVIALIRGRQGGKIKWGEQAVKELIRLNITQAKSHNLLVEIKAELKEQGRNIPALDRDTEKLEQAVDSNQPAP